MVLPEGSPQLAKDEFQFFSICLKRFGTEVHYPRIQIFLRRLHTAMMHNRNPDEP